MSFLSRLNVMKTRKETFREIKLGLFSGKSLDKSVEVAEEGQIRLYITSPEFNIDYLIATVITNPTHNRIKLKPDQECGVIEYSIP